MPEDRYDMMKRILERYGKARNELLALTEAAHIAAVQACAFGDLGIWSDERVESELEGLSVDLESAALPLDPRRPG